MYLTSVLNRRTWAEIWATEYPRMFLWAPAAQGAGIFAYFSLNYEPNLTFAAAFFAISAIVMIYLRFIASPAGFIYLLFYLVFFFSLGFTASACASKLYGTHMADKPLGPVIVSATIADMEARENGIRLSLDNPEIRGFSYKNYDASEIPAAEETPRRIYTVFNDRFSESAKNFEPGQKIKFAAQIMPFSEPLSPYGFDFRRSNYFNGIGATGYAKTKGFVAKEEDGFGLRRLFAASRGKMNAEASEVLAGDIAALAKAFLTGEQSSISAKTKENIRTAGLSHLLSVSGLHIGLAAGIVFFLLRSFSAAVPYFALRYPIKKWAAFAALLSSALYTFQVGAPVATKRSLLMAAIVLAGIIFDRASFSLRSAMLAAIAILTFWPHVLMLPSFQLSFAAVVALISANERQKNERSFFANKEGFGWHALGKTANAVKMSFVATAATLPFSLYHFGEAGVYGVLANMAALPLTGLWIMPMCVLTYAAWPLGLAEYPLIAIGYGMELLSAIAERTSSLPGALIGVPPFSPIYPTTAAIGGLFFCLVKSEIRYAGLLTAVAALLLGITSPRPDFLIHPQGKYAGYMDKETKELVIITRERPDKFLAENWRTVLGAEKDKIIYAAENENRRGLLCDAESCVIGEERAAALIKTPEGLQRVCEKNHDLVVNPLNDDACENANIRVINRKSLRDLGAHAVYSGKDGIMIRTTRDYPEKRPWSDKNQ